MLRYIALRDFVIVARLELFPQAGLTALTGETGAGKSILLDALSLVLGERASGHVVRQGARQAELVAEFDLTALPAVETWLAQRDHYVDAEKICRVRRVIDTQGRGRIYLNDCAVSLAFVRQLGVQLVQIHSQHAQQALLNAAWQREWLDASEQARPVVLAVTQAWQCWQQARRARETWEENAVAFALEREQLRWQRQELAALEFSPEAWAEWQSEHRRLTHAASLLAGAQQATEQISDGEHALTRQLHQCCQALHALLAYDEQLSDIIGLLDSAAIGLQEAAYGLRHYQQQLSLDPEELARLEQRLTAVHTLCRKYRLTPMELPALSARIEARLALVGANDDPSSTLIAAEQAAEAAYYQQAHALSAIRAQTAAALQVAVMPWLPALALPEARFAVVLHPCAPSAHGLEQVEMQFSQHHRLPLRPLAKVASGGELARIGLALVVVGSQTNGVPSLIFDEVDTGMGGQVATTVGQLLRQLAQQHQVLCVTHLPQVAAFAQQQWQIQKVTNAEGVLSQVSTLARREQRVEELARMLGGAPQTARQHAHELLADAGLS